MTTFFVILAIIIAILLVLIVLVQNPKGGGLTSGFSSTNNIMGVQRTGDFLEKGSWGLAIALFVLAVLINLNATTSTGGGSKSNSRIQEQIDKTTVPSSLPAMPNSADTTKN